MKTLLLNGACGVGKTTLAKAWAKRHHGAIVECDYFTEWIFNPDFPHWSAEEERLVAELSAGVAGKYLDAGMPVAIENVWTPAGLDLLRTLLRNHPGVHSVTVVLLHCQIEENRRRDALRPPENQMRERVDVVRQELMDHTWPKYVNHLETSSLSIRETLDQIEVIQGGESP